MTSRRLRLSRMPGVVTGEVCGPQTLVRVRVTAPWSVNAIFTVWASARELRRSG